MDYSGPPPEGDRPPERPVEGGEGEEGEHTPPREEPRFSPFTIGAVLIAIAIAGIAVLLGQTSVGNEPEPPQSPQPGEGFLSRIDLDDLLRITEPWITLYQQDLYPFNITLRRPGASRPSKKEPPKVELRRAADSSTLDAADGPSSGIDPIVGAERIVGINATVGKLVLPSGKHCTASLVEWDVIITSDHCLPWNETNTNSWKSIKFTPAYDAFADDEYGPKPYGTATVRRCVGINPPLKGAKDMAVCHVDWPNLETLEEDEWPLFPNPPRADFGFPARPEQTDEQFFEGTVWHAIGYTRKFHNAQSPGHYGGFLVGPNQVFPDTSVPAQNCTLLKTPFFADQGWSGAPVFNRQANTIIAIVTACAGPDEDQRACDTATVTEFAGGSRMGALVVWGLAEWHPELGLSQSGPKT